VWAEEAFASWRRAGFGHGATVVDVGCGPGFASIDLAHLVGPKGRVIAVDASQKFLAHLDATARAQGLGNIDTLCTDVQTLTLPPASIDGAYARWLLCFLSDPEAVVRTIASALKPGGTFVAMDYFNYGAFTLAPRSAAMDHVIAAVQESWRRSGGDLEIQGRLPGIMRDCGLEVGDVRCIAKIARPGSPEWLWPESFFASFLITLVEMDLVSEAEAQAFRDDWNARAQDPASYMALPLQYEIIGRKN
jgi:SAM-dependent methyltransferase